MLKYKLKKRKKEKKKSEETKQGNTIKPPPMITNVSCDRGFLLDIGFTRTSASKSDREAFIFTSPFFETETL